MSELIKKVEIENFKSIKKISMDAKRINVFIGKPNVGKSNILEALSLLGASYGLNTLYNNTEGFLSEFIRYEEVSNLFFDQDLKKEVSVSTNIGTALLRYHYNNINKYDLVAGSLDKDKLSEFIKGTSINDIYKNFQTYVDNPNLNKPESLVKPLYLSLHNNGSISYNPDNLTSSNNAVKKYDFVQLDFKAMERSTNLFPDFLLPPYGENIFAIVHGNMDLRKEITPMFKPYGLELVLKIREKKFEIQKKTEDIVDSYPYSTIADTLQRIIFYLSAIESNNNSVLLFEEPEAHSFPPYTSMLAERIISSTNNQFFLTTHSPYLLQSIIQKTRLDELNIFITYYENYETKIKRLGKEEIQEIVDESIDVFYNLDKFLING